MTQHKTQFILTDKKQEVERKEYCNGELRLLRTRAITIGHWLENKKYFRRHVDFMTQCAKERANREVKGELRKRKMEGS